MLRMLNARSIAVLDDISIYKRILIHRVTYYSNNLEEGWINRCNSPIFDLLKVSEFFSVYNDIMGMFQGVREFGKKEWKGLIWVRIWESFFGVYDDVMGVLQGTRVFGENSGRMMMLCMLEMLKRMASQRNIKLYGVPKNYRKAVNLYE